MNSFTCSNCAYYHQHYIMDSQSMTAINCGHCIYPRIKHREPGTEACQYYAQRTTPPALPDRERVIQFLTTELLQYVLSLDLPPEQK